MTGWRVAEHISIYREEGWYAAHPTVVRTTEGDLLVLYHRSPFLGYSQHSHPLFDIRGGPPPCAAVRGISWA